MEKKTVLVTGIGGNVGQGILRNIIATKYPIRLVGTNVEAMSAGNHWVDEFYKVPYGNDSDYIPAIKNIVDNEKVDLIIPSTDFEIFSLSRNIDEINCKIACSGKYSSEIYLDKYLTFCEHKKHNIPFVETYLPTDYVFNTKKALAKPRKGRGSRGILKNIDSNTIIPNDYIIQDQIEGIEITTAVYRRYKDNEFHSLITFERTLDNGTTNYCKVVSEYDQQIKEIAVKIINCTDIKGSFNIQSIVSSSGKIFPFEINCRISGTNSIRSAFSFTDVCSTIEELLYDIEIKPYNLKFGAAYRFLSDVIYLNDNSQPLKCNNLDNFIEF